MYPLWVSLLFRSIGLFFLCFPSKFKIGKEFEATAEFVIISFISTYMNFLFMLVDLHE